MSQSQRGSDRGRLPVWAGVARSSFRLLVTAWAVLYAAALVVWVGSKVFGYDLPSGPTSGGVVFGATVALAAIAGVLWLIGEGAAGLKDE